MDAPQAWEQIAALSRPLQPFDTDRRAALERILRVTEEAGEVHAGSGPMRDVAELAVSGAGAQEMRTLTSILARIYAIALVEAARLRHES